MSEQIGHRDAIHVPYIVVVCGTLLSPGDKLSLSGSSWPDDGNSKLNVHHWRGKPDDCHGIADPFREDMIPANEPFRIYIRQGYFGSMRHVFFLDMNDDGGTSTCHSVCEIH